MKYALNGKQVTKVADARSIRAWGFCSREVCKATPAYRTVAVDGNETNLVDIYPRGYPAPMRESR